MKSNTKEMIQYGSAIVMIISAIVLVFVSFVLTLAIGNGVLAYVGEAFGSALMIFGIVNYFRSQFNDFKADCSKVLEDVKREAHNEITHQENSEEE